MPDMFLTQDLYWLAGLLEGEGTFDCTGKSNTPRVRMTMTDLDVMIRAASMLGAHNVVAVKKRDNHKQAYYLAVHGKPAIDWMMRLYPIMGERREKKIEDCIAIWRERENWTGRQKQAPKKGPALSSPRSVWTNPEMGGEIKNS